MQHPIDKTFDEARLPLPPLPGQLAGSLQSWDAWTFGIEEPDAPLYEIEHYIDKAFANPDEPFLYIGHSGYGANNWHLHYYLNLGPIALFVQTPWGGAFQEDEDTREALDRYFPLVNRILAAAPNIEQKRSEQRLFAIQTAAGGSKWGWISDPNHPVWELDVDALESASVAAANPSLADK